MSLRAVEKEARPKRSAGYYVAAFFVWTTCYGIGGALLFVALGALRRAITWALWG